MATGNFYYKDRLFVVVDEGDDSYDVLTYNIRGLLNKLAREAKSKNKDIMLTVLEESVPFTPKSECNNRYYTNQHGSIIAETEFMNVNITVMLDVLVRAGYYEHANIDHALSIEADGIELPETATANDVLDSFDLVDMADMGFSESWIAENKHELEKRLTDMRKIVLETYSVVTGQFATEHKLDAQMSNGEAFYSQSEPDDVPAFEVLDYSDTANATA